MHPYVHTCKHTHRQTNKYIYIHTHIHNVEKEINPRCKYTEFVILDFSEISYSKEPILSHNSNNTVNVRHNISDFHYTELTPLGKVPQNKSLGLISYSTVHTYIHTYGC